MNTLAIQALAAASLSLLAVAPAAAEPVRATVQYGDLDVASPAGAALFAERLEAGIDAVCARPDNRDLKASAAWQACKDEARSSAVAQLGRLGAAFEGASLAALD